MQFGDLQSTSNRRSRNTWSSYNSRTSSAALKIACAPAHYDGRSVLLIPLPAHLSPRPLSQGQSSGDLAGSLACRLWLRCIAPGRAKPESPPIGPKRLPLTKRSTPVGWLTGKPRRDKIARRETATLLRPAILKNTTLTCWRPARADPW